jgi:hypothetical protein
MAARGGVGLWVSAWCEWRFPSPRYPPVGFTPHRCSRGRWVMMKSGQEHHGWKERTMETERDLTLDGGTGVHSTCAQERERLDQGGDGGYVVGPGHWGWDRIELRSAGWRICGEARHSMGSGPEDTWRWAGRTHVA